MNKHLKFHLKRPKESKTSIYAKTSFNGVTFKYSTGLIIYCDLWDSQLQKPTRKKSLISKYQKQYPNITSELENISISLDNLQFYLNDYLREIKEERINVDLQKLRNYLDARFKKIASKDNDNVPLTEYVKLHIQGLTTYKNSAGESKSYSLGTIKHYNQFLSKWREFEKASKKWRYEEIDLANFYEKYTDFLKGSGLSTNTIGRHVSKLKVILSAAFDKGYHNNLAFQSKSFQAISKRKPAVYLTHKELKQLHDTTFVGDDEKYRDLFLLGCRTAQRISDYKRIGIENIKEIVKDGKEIEVIEVIQKKTGVKALIPVDAISRSIIKKYPNGFSEIKEQVFNRRIKVICKQAGINDRILVGDTYKPKYELITSHIARKTGATLMAFAGEDLNDIRRITGHSSLDRLKTYIGTDLEFTAHKMSTGSYYSQSFMKVV